jgi:type I restriction enzyme S subunit
MKDNVTDIESDEIPYELPKGWIRVKLEGIIDILDGKRIPVNSDEREERISNKSQAELYPYYGATGRVGSIDDYIFDEELVLLGEDGAPFLETSKNKAYVIKGKTWVNNHAHVLRAIKNVTSNLFLCHYFNLFDYHGYVTGTTRLKLNQSLMRTIPVPFPPLAEQNRIVVKIEELFTKLDAGIESLKKVRAQLKQYRQAVLKSAVEGKLTVEWRAIHKDELEPASVLLERIRKEKNKDSKYAGSLIDDKQDTMADLPDLPDGWVWVDIDHLSENDKNSIKAGPFGSSLKKEFYVSSGYKIYGQEQVIRNDPFYGEYYIDKERYELLKSCAVKPNDILISLVGTIGKVLILPEGIETGIINPRLVKLSLKKGLVAPKFIKIYFESYSVKHYFSLVSHGGTMEILNLGILKKLPIPIPSLLEQKTIVDEVERLLSIADEVELIINAELKRAERLRQSILKQSFSGKLVPQDPNDEPASALLERIKQEKAKSDSTRQMKLL